MNKEQKMVRRFHKKFGFTLNEIPTNIDRELGMIRHKHTLREMDELREAIETGNLTKIADALADSLYLLYGTAVAYGIDLEPVFAEIHRSNMTKDRPNPDKDVDAKALKGENYSPPDLESIIEDQRNNRKNR